jgi:hypothetical protein
VIEDQGQHKEDVTNEAMGQVMRPKLSYWPIVLATSLTLTLVGVVLMSHPIVFWVGVAFVIVSFIGGGLERR